MKKTLALVLALAMVFSTITVAFAEDTLSADAQICADLGMLKGETGTVDAAYTATAPSRIQAAVMFLRLKGLEEEAKAFTGEDNFADADKAAWAKPIMAYLKANPQLGWLGDGTNFNPTDKITAQMYYKVLLESLGYKQNTAEVVGDFTWENVIEFAAGIGLSKVAAVTNFTVNDLAVATVEALKATVKEGGKTLIASLIEAGKVDAAKAEELGLYAGSSTSTEAKLDSVIASANDKVEVTFDAEVEKAFAENADNYKIVLKGSTTALEVKEAKAVNEKIVELTTAAQTGGAAYTLTVGDVSKNFAGVAKSSGAPEVDTVKCIDTDTVEVVFKKAMDRASVEDVANYTLNNGATVKAAELWIDQDDSRQTVKLTTEGVANNKVYKLKIANVKSADMVAIKTVEKSFAGVTDTKAPTIKGNVKVKNNQRIWVTFDDKHGVDKESAENIANWNIDGLTITKITALDDDGDDYGYYEVVEIDTEPMDSNHKYTLTVSNLVDGSVSKNAIAKTLTKTFYGVAVDKTAPKAGSISVLGDNMVEIVFTDTNRLDAATATDVSNYTFNEGLQVLSASIVRPTKPDTALGKTVVLTTSTMDTDTTYKLTIENVADEFGNVMTKVNNRALPRSKGADIAPPAVKKVEWADENTVKVYFDERLDADSANDPANYTINNDIGVVRKAELSGSSGYTRVDLTTPDLVNNKKYKITISGVKDRLGNTMSDYVVEFTSGMKSADTEMPEIDNIVAVNEDEVRITFDEPVIATPTGSTDMTISWGNQTRNLVIVGQAAKSLYTIDDNTTVVFKLSSGKITTNDEITIDTLKGIKDKHNNTYILDTSDKPTFYGNTDVNDDPEVVAIDQISVKKLQVTFSEPVIAPATISANGITFTAEVDEDEDETTDALSVVTLTSSGLIPYEKDFKFNFSVVTDYAGKGSEDTAYEYTAYLDDDDNPVIDYVEAVSTTKIQVHFNESIASPGTYTIKDGDGKVVNVTNMTAMVDGDDDTIVNVTFNNNGPGWKVKPGEVYTLIPKTAARDIKGNPLKDLSDLEFDFVASAVTKFDYIKGVQIIDANTIKVIFTTAMDVTAVAPAVPNDTLVVTEDGKSLDLVNSFGSDDSNEIIVNLKYALLDGVDYKVTTTGAVRDEYVFEGILADGGIEIETGGIVTFSGYNATDFVVWVVYEGNHEVLAPLSATDATPFEITASVYTSLGIDTGDEYTVEVYRVLTPATAWGGSYNAVADDAILYSRRFIKE